jgi:hypothetical protein
MSDLQASYRFLAPALKEAGYRVACTDLRPRRQRRHVQLRAARVPMDLRQGSRQDRRWVYGVLHGLVLPVWRGMGSRPRRALSRLGGAAVVTGLGRSGLRACESRRAGCVPS